MRDVDGVVERRAPTDLLHESLVDALRDLPGVGVGVAANRVLRDGRAARRICEAMDDELGKLIESVKAYLGYERDLLMRLTTLRAQVGSGGGPSEARLEAEREIGSRIGSTCRLRRLTVPG